MSRPSPRPFRSLVPAIALLLPGGLGGQDLTVPEIDRRVEAGRAEAFALYRELLTFPNDAHRPDDILELVAWLEAAFHELGFSTERLATEGSPLLLAERPAAEAGERGAAEPGARGPAAPLGAPDREAGRSGASPASPTVLVYLQADGQPVEPAAWDQESPWIPVLKERAPDGRWREIPWERLYGAAIDPEWRVFARSASDSKGPIAQFLSALRLAEEAGVRPEFGLKVIVDTEEEMGSPHLPAAVERYRDRLAADMLVIFDGPPHASGRPTLKFGARGIALVTLTTYGPTSPVHSGHYGNWVPNPVFRLADLLASLKDADGRVAIPGWYEGVSIDAETRRVLAAVPDDEERLRRELGFAAPERVAGSLQEAIQYPSLNVRGVRAAWVGEEARTLIPAAATAEIDVRLVAESDPERLLGLLRDHLRGRGYLVLDRPPTAEELLAHPRIATLVSAVRYGAFRTPFDSEPGRWLGRALHRLHGEEPVRIRTSGGSIPISPFVRTLGVPAVSVPTVNPDNNQHAPNENLRVGAFLDGIRTILAILGEPLEG